MQTVADMKDRAETYLRQEGASTPAALTKLLYAVYNDGWRDMRDEAIKEAAKVEANAATKRTENEAGLSVQQGRRLAASEIGIAIAARSVAKEEARGSV